MFFKAKSNGAGRTGKPAEAGMIVLSDAAVLQISGGAIAQASSRQTTNVASAMYKSSASKDAFTRG